MTLIQLATPVILEVISCDEMVIICVPHNVSYLPSSGEDDVMSTISTASSISSTTDVISILSSDEESESGIGCSTSRSAKKRKRLKNTKEIFKGAEYVVFYCCLFVKSLGDSGQLHYYHSPLSPAVWLISP